MQVTRKNISEAEVGRRIGMTRQSVNKILNGQTDPPVSRVLDIIEALEIKVVVARCLP